MTGETLSTPWAATALAAPPSRPMSFVHVLPGHPVEDTVQTTASLAAPWSQASPAVPDQAAISSLDGIALNG